MNSRILIDAGPLVALFDVNENQHKKIYDFFASTEYRFISTLAVYTEVSHLLDFSTKTQQDFYEWVSLRGVILADINQNDMPRIAELTKKYADLPMDFADATLLVAAEKSGIMEIISLDKDFDIYRLADNKMLRNVYLEQYR